MWIGATLSFSPRTLSLNHWSGAQTPGGPECFWHICGFRRCGPICLPWIFRVKKPREHDERRAWKSQEKPTPPAAPIRRKILTLRSVAFVHEKYDQNRLSSTGEESTIYEHKTFAFDLLQRSNNNVMQWQPLCMFASIPYDVRQRVCAQNAYDRRWLYRIHSLYIHRGP